MANTESGPLRVFEYGGTARSGKGTIVADIAEGNPTIATEETGADYRTLTRVLIDEGQIEPGMPDEIVAATVGRIATPAITSIVARRHELVSEKGLPSLYNGDVNGLVSAVSPIIAVRKAVKAGFVRRVEAIVGDEQHDKLLVDGRNLAPVVAAIPGAKLVMRTFVSCLAIEGAMREVARNGQEGDSEALWNAYRAIDRRNTNDADRTVDPVKPDEDAVDYWYDRDLFTYSLRRIADRLYGGDLTRAAVETFSGFREYTDVVRHGAGAKAVITGRQIHFDTTAFRSYQGKPKGRMLEAAHAMFDEALITDTAQSLGLVDPDSRWLRYYEAAYNK
jgi:cytidylate kinase